MAGHRGTKKDVRTADKASSAYIVNSSSVQLQVPLLYHSSSRKVPWGQRRPQVWSLLKLFHAFKLQFVCCNPPLCACDALQLTLHMHAFRHCGPDHRTLQYNLGRLSAMQHSLQLLELHCPWRMHMNCQVHPIRRFVATDA